jgi:hypothetical protein
MRIIEFTIEPSWVYQTHTDVIEVDDDATNEDVERAVADAVNNACSYGWTELPVD